MASAPRNEFKTAVRPSSPEIGFPRVINEPNRRDKKKLESL